MEPEILKYLYDIRDLLPLEDELKCRVDLLTFHGLKNPYFRRIIEEERVNIYGA